MKAGQILSLFYDVRHNFSFFFIKESDDGQTVEPKKRKQMSADALSFSFSTVYYGHHRNSLTFSFKTSSLSSINCN